MAFDIVSFAIGLTAGALTGVLAGYLHETETMGELQERVRLAILQFERVGKGAAAQGGVDPSRADLQRKLSELQDEIKKLYRKSSR